MSATPLTGYERLAPVAAARVDEACDRFERAWRDGQRPAIEKYADGAAGPDRAVLVRELILVEAPYRRRAGEEPQPADYRARFPDLDETWLERALVPPAEASTCPLAPAPTASVAAPPAIPGYEILGELGRGGMGVVFKARQIALDRLVAVKMILSGPATTEADLERFRAEAEAVARLHHPNIVQVFEAGAADGHPYLAMEYVPAGNLAQAAGGAPVPPRRAAELVRTVALAAQHAHERGIVHRDLKPANVLMADERSPKIADFGLVKRLDDDSARTRTGVILGTPSYMAPEQTTGRGTEVGPAADVYALGAILYELLAGRPPFTGESALDTLDRVRAADPVPPRAIRPDVPPDLETICLKCLRKVPGARYPSALALADDLGLFLAGDPISARPSSAGERVARWARRRPARAAVLAAAALALVVGLPTVTWLWRRAEAALDRESAALRTVGAELNAKRVALAHRAWTDGNLAEARAQLAETGEPFRTPEWEALWRAVTAERVVYREHAGLPGRVAFSPDGRSVASMDGGQVRLWEADTGRTLVTFAEPYGPGTDLAFGPDGTTVVTSTSPAAGAPEAYVEVAVRDAATGREVRRFRRPVRPSAAAFSPDGRHLAVLGFPTVILDVATGAEVWSSSGAAGLGGLAWSADGRHLVLARQALLKVAAGREPAKVVVIDLDGSGARDRAVAFDPPEPVAPANFAVSADGRRLAFSRPDPRERAVVQVWDLQTGRRVIAFPTTADPAAALAFRPDGRYLAVASADRTVRLWEADTGREALVLRGHPQAVGRLAFRPDGARLATTGADKAVRVWDVTAPDR